MTYAPAEFVSYTHSLKVSHFRRTDWEIRPTKCDILSTGLCIRMDEGQGCEELLAAVQRVRPLLHLFGHIHQDGGLWQVGPTWFANGTTWESTRRASILDVDAAARTVTAVRSIPHADPFSRDAQRSAGSIPLRCASRLNRASPQLFFSSSGLSTGSFSGTSSRLYPSFSRASNHFERLPSVKSMRTPSFMARFDDSAMMASAIACRPSHFGCGRSLLPFSPQLRIQ